MKVLIANRQRRHRINRPALIRLTRWLMTKAAAMNPDRHWVECSVVVVGHRGMIALNEKCLGHEGTTDVITFAYPTIPGETPTGWRGEIIVNIEEAAETSARRGGVFSRELALYLAHGCQHLGGADDQTPAQRSAMNRRQYRWLKDAEELGLL